MGKQYKKLKEKDIEFIQEAKLFYLASCSGAEVNLSPKGYDSIRVLDESTLLFMQYPGSGNRTYRDTVADGEVTLVFNAFVGKPQILRLFCKAEIVERDDADFDAYAKQFGEINNIVRNFFRFNIYAVETSCGEAVPIMEYKEDRSEYREWAIKLDEKGKLNEYNAKTFTPVDLSKVAN